MAVTDGVVVWLGADHVGRALHPDAEVIDLAGAFVTPAFVEPHLHTTAFGLRSTGLDLSAADSLTHCLTLLRDYAARYPDGAILGDGWDETRWPEGRPPTVADIDAAAGPGRPVYLARVDAHSAVASTALLDAVPQLDHTPGFRRGEPVRAQAHHLVRAAARGLLTREQRDAARRRALDTAAARGVVAVHECAGPEIEGDADLRELLAFPHGVAGAFLTASTFVAAIGMWWMARNTYRARKLEQALESGDDSQVPATTSPSQIDATPEQLRTDNAKMWRPVTILGLWVIIASGIALFITGDQQARLMFQQQPMKMAAAESLCTTETGASLSLGRQDNVIHACIHA